MGRSPVRRRGAIAEIPLKGQAVTVIIKGGILAGYREILAACLEISHRSVVGHLRYRHFLAEGGGFLAIGNSKLHGIAAGSGKVMGRTYQIGLLAVAEIPGINQFIIVSVNNRSPEGKRLLAGARSHSRGNGINNRSAVAGITGNADNLAGLDCLVAVLNSQHHIVNAGLGIGMAYRLAGKGAAITHGPGIYRAGGSISGNRIKSYRAVRIGGHYHIGSQIIRGNHLKDIGYRGGNLAV